MINISGNLNKRHERKFTRRCGFNIKINTRDVEKRLSGFHGRLIYTKADEESILASGAESSFPARENFRYPARSSRNIAAIFPE